MPDANSTLAPPATAAVHPGPDGRLVIQLAGSWRLGTALPDPLTVIAQLKGVAGLVLDGTGLGAWDSSVLTYLRRVIATGSDAGIPVDRSRLPAGVQRLLALADAVPERAGAKSAAKGPSFLTRVGQGTLHAGEGVWNALDFLGRVVLGFGRLFTGRARIYWPDVWIVMQQVGADALGVVLLVNFLVGLIVAFVGAAQLEQFGASIYVANLVGVGMVRDLAAIMTAIVMAGRSGAAFAAQLGSMTASQEVDALTTLGISPIEFLVLPRVAALVLMMPILAVFADGVSILGGATVGAVMLDIELPRYLRQTAEAVAVKHLLGGLFKATVYGGLVALAGCLRGLTSGRSAADVGNAVTSAVVTSIILIISAAGLFAVLFSALHL